MSLSPPDLTGVMWSTSKTTEGGVLPQYWHVKESRLKTSKRIFLDRPFLFISSTPETKIARTKLVASGVDETAKSKEYSVRAG